MKVLASTLKDIIAASSLAWDEISSNKGKLEEEFKGYISKLLPGVDVNFETLESGKTHVMMHADIPNAPGFARNSVTAKFGVHDTADYDSGSLSKTAKERIKKGIELLIDKKAVYTRSGKPLMHIGNY